MRQWICNPRYRSGGWGHPGGCGHVTSGTGPVKVFHHGDWMCDFKKRVWSVGSPLRLWMCVCSYRVWEGVTLETVEI